MAYFDNAATTFPKPEEVYSYMDQFYRECGASAGRGHYSLSQNTAKMVAETRSLIQDLLHCPAKQVVFTPTATIALNIIMPGKEAHSGPYAAKLGIVTGDTVKVSSRRGGLVVEARVTDIVPEGVLFMPFHFADGPANVLTNTALDPTAKIPELKVCAARIEKA